MNVLEFLRQVTIFNYAILDLILALGGIYLLSNRLSKIFLKINIKVPRLNWVFLTLPFSIIIHLIFGNITPMTRDFMDLYSHYFLKIFIICLIIFGIRGIKIIKK